LYIKFPLQKNNKILKELFNAINLGEVKSRHFSERLRINPAYLSMYYMEILG
jgi:hypothetical protein